MSQGSVAVDEKFRAYTAIPCQWKNFQNRL